MFPFHCNQCYNRQKIKNDLELHVSRCGHILCKDCVQDKCCICSRPFQSVPINKDMPKPMAEYFSNPIKQYQHYQKVMKFRIDQERRLVQHLCKNNPEELKKVRQKREAYIKLQERLNLEDQHEVERIRKMREYIAYHERRFEQVRYMTPPITAQPRPRYPSRSNSAHNLAPIARSNNNMMPSSTQTLRPNIIYPRSPTVSDRTGSTATEVTTEIPKSIPKAQRTPPPLLSFSQHNLLKQQQLSFNSTDFDLK